jgi:hypothetical protein
VVGPDYLDEYDQYLEEARKRQKGKEDLCDFQEYLDGLKNSRVRGFEGARSLEDVAIEVLLQNIADITLEGIECLPQPIVRRIWHAVNKRCLICFNTWMIFSQVLNEGETSTLNLLRYRQAIKTPRSPLHIYTEPLTSKSFDFLTSLSITTSFPMPDLVKLSSITNLGILEIVNPTKTKGHESLDGPFPKIGDRLIRAWAQAALNHGAFSVLRILKLWNHQDLTSNSLVYVNSFPALAVYDVQGCGFDLRAKVDARRLGWKSTLDTNILGLLEAVCVERAMLMQVPLGLDFKSLRRASSQQLWDGAKIKRMPRADVPKFLTRADNATPGQPPKPFPYVTYREFQEYLDQEVRNNARVQKLRWRALDWGLFQKFAALETWEFRNYTTFARIGEVRNDQDLQRAGVIIGDQAVIGDELVSSVPMVSLRLGQNPLCLQPSLVNNAHKPFYCSMYSDSPASSLKYNWEEKVTSDQWSIDSNPRNLAFIRIKIPPQAPPATGNDTGLSSHPTPSDKSEKAPSGVVPARVAPPKRVGSGGLRHKKKQKLANVLSSFLPR